MLTQPNPLDEVQPADLAHMIRQPRVGPQVVRRLPQFVLEFTEVRCHVCPFG